MSLSLHGQNQERELLFSSECHPQCFDLKFAQYCCMTASTSNCIVHSSCISVFGSVSNNLLCLQNLNLERRLQQAKMPHLNRKKREG